MQQNQMQAYIDAQLQAQIQQQQIQHQQQMMFQQQQMMQNQAMGPPQPVQQQLILCCLCGASIPPNPANMCVSCIRTQADVTEGITKHGTLFQCRQCLRFLGTKWIACELESKELLAICLKKVHGLNKAVRLIDAGFVWTEPHSRRIKVRLVVQGEVLNGTILQQSVVVEYEVHNQQCPDCQRSFTPHDAWKAVVQLRQKVAHKRTFLFLEQLILKHKMNGDALRIKENGDGLDFYFGHRSHASRFNDFIHHVTPARSKTAKKLISQDFSSNVANFNYSFSVEIAPICKDDLVLLPPKVARSLGSISQLVLVNRISSLMHFVDPFTLQQAEMNSTQYWASEFRPLAVRDQLVEYCVIDIEPCGPVHGKMVLSEATIARASDFGANDRMFTVVTHLGALLRPGDSVLGYDVGCSNFNNDDLANYQRELPDVVLVRKKYNVPRRHKKRVFKLQFLDKETEDAKPKKGKDEQRIKQTEEFYCDLEEDPDLRGRINLFKKGPEDDTVSTTTTAAETTGEADPTFPTVQLEELLDGLTIDDVKPMEE